MAYGFNINSDDINYDILEEVASCIYAIQGLHRIFIKKFGVDNWDEHFAFVDKIFIGGELWDPDYMVQDNDRFRHPNITIAAMREIEQVDCEDDLRKLTMLLDIKSVPKLEWKTLVNVGQVLY